MLVVMRARVCALLLLAACKPSVGKAIEANLGQKVTEMGLHASKLTCPDDVEAKPGQVFTCQVTLDAPTGTSKQAKTYAVDVTIKRVDLAKSIVDYDNAWHDGPAVQTAKAESMLAADLEKDLGGPLILSCGNEPIVFLDADHKLHCALTAGDVKTKATFSFDVKTLNPTDWHLDPPLIGKAKIEAVLTPAVHEKVPDDVVIDCGPAPFLLRPADGVLTCKVNRGGETASLKIEVDEGLNVKRWEISQ